MSVAGKGGRPLGLPKTGGRKKGTPNKATAAVADKLAVIGCDPILVLAHICMDEKSPLDARIRSAIELASYVYPKRRPVETPDPQQSTYEVRTIVEAGPVSLPDTNHEN